VAFLPQAMLLLAKDMEWTMKLSISIALLLMAAIPASADRAVTDAEREKLVAAVVAQGCSGGKMEADDDDGEFEVDDVTCNDGRKYELEFDAQFGLKKKELED
jgi:peptidase YpeB-like protein